MSLLDLLLVCLIGFLLTESSCVLANTESAVIEILFRETATTGQCTPSAGPWILFADSCFL